MPGGYQILALHQYKRPKEKMNVYNHNVICSEIVAMTNRYTLLETFRYR
jgi:hypothetical protein